MMLGAKQRKIGQLILLETVVIGVIASVIGILVGWLLTGTLGNFMMSVVIGSRLKHFSAFYLPAVVTTVALPWALPYCGCCELVEFDEDSGSAITKG